MRSQKAQVLRSIEQIAKKQKYGAGAGLSGNSVEARMATERRHHDETKGKLWQNCTRIIADLLKNGNTKLYFGEPVRGDYYPGYYEIIKEPRDLGTIKKNLDSRTHYKNIYELRDDVRLCFENCRMFNPQGHQVRNFGDAASNAFEKKWAAKNVEAEWEGELQRHKLAMDRLQEIWLGSANRLTLPWIGPSLERTLAVMGADYWSYGFAGNRAEIAAICRYSSEQHLAARPVTPDLNHQFSVQPLALTWWLTVWLTTQEEESRDRESLVFFSRIFNLRSRFNST